MTEKDFSLDDVTDEFGDETILGAYYISNDRYRIEYYEFIDIETVRETYELNYSFVKGTISDPIETLSDGNNKGYSMFQDYKSCYYIAYKENVFFILKLQKTIKRTLHHFLKSLDINNIIFSRDVISSV